MTTKMEDFDPNSCETCGSQQCVSFRGADCPAMDAVWQQLAAEEMARAYISLEEGVALPLDAPPSVPWLTQEECTVADIRSILTHSGVARRQQERLRGLREVFPESFGLFADY